MHASHYQQRFAGHMQIFSQRRSELQNTILISAYMMAGIDTANLAVMEVSQTLDSMDCILEHNGGSKEDRRGQTVEQATG
jgi:hypothetical protein